MKNLKVNVFLIVADVELKDKPARPMFVYEAIDGLPKLAAKIDDDVALQSWTSQQGAVDYIEKILCKPEFSEIKNARVFTGWAEI